MLVHKFSFKFIKLISQMARYLGAALLIWIAVIHVHLWLEGYRDIPIVGILFLANSVAGLALAIALLVWRKPLLGLVGVVFSLVTLFSLLYSINFSLFGFKESSGASFVTISIVIEIMASFCLLLWWIFASRY